MNIRAAVRSHMDREKNFQNAVKIIMPKLENSPDDITAEDADRLHSREVRAHGSVEKGGIKAQAQSLAAKNEQAKDEAAKVEVEEDKAAKNDHVQIAA
jgi:hypothetical protein